MVTVPARFDGNSLDRTVNIIAQNRTVRILPRLDANPARRRVQIR